jgi:cytochrome c
MKIRFPLYGTGVVLAALVTAAAWPALAQDVGPPERRGAALLSQHCGMCHAVGREDGSAEPQAPALRTIGRRVPLERLEAQLGTGLLGGHPVMPKFTFAPRDAVAIMRYLRSIQQP